MQRTFMILLSVLAISIGGCTSLRSTILQHCSDHRFVFNKPKKVSGVPVKLKVPTHLAVSITETYLVVKEPGMPAKPASIVFLEHPQLNVKTEMIYTEKVFTVDFLRPMAGKLALSNTTFDSEQYFRTIKAEYEEKTLKDVTAAIGTLKGNFKGGAKTSAGPTVGDGIAEKVIPEERTVAYQRFDISDPCWEEEMHGFVDQHLAATP